MQVVHPPVLQSRCPCPSSHLARSAWLPAALLAAPEFLCQALCG